MNKNTIENIKKAHAKLKGPFTHSHDEYGGYVQDARGEFCTGQLPSGEPDIPMAEFLAASLTYMPEIIERLEATEAKWNCLKAWLAQEGEPMEAVSRIEAKMAELEVKQS